MQVALKVSGPSALRQAANGSAMWHASIIQLTLVCQAGAMNGMIIPDVRVKSMCPYTSEHFSSKARPSQTHP